MRLWSLHPKYLDAKGIVALWREGLLAKHVLEGKTKGYTMHPQLNRFKNAENPLVTINKYLGFVLIEAKERGYNFNADKILKIEDSIIVPVNSGQIEYESAHLLRKLQIRDAERYHTFKSLSHFEPNPMFEVISGGIEDWEVILP